MVAAAALAAALAAAWLPACARAGASCPQIACDKYVRNASWTGRFAIVVSGHVRMAHDQLPTLKRIVAANGGREKVDVVYHVWHNSSAPCEVASLAELEGFAAVVTTEPWACMWSVARGGDRGGARRAALGDSPKRREIGSHPPSSRARALAPCFSLSRTGRTAKAGRTSGTASTARCARSSSTRAAT